MHGNNMMIIQLLILRQTFQQSLRVKSALSQWVLGMMINALRMTSLYGVSHCGLSWIYCFRMRMMQQLYIPIFSSHTLIKPIS
ncbi:unnamed protein product, partial [Vitis vinifera]|uniref:Uncharacterized protein n=1 Tax=Vitis vinifera TaxID=29760 RepID=D7UC92_VITVI